MNTLAVVSQSGETLSFFDVSTGENTGLITGLISEPHEIIFDSKRNVLYISHAYAHGHYWEHGDYAHEISVVDCAQRKVVDTISVLPAKGTHGLAIDELRDILYVSVESGIPNTNPGGGILGIDLNTRKVIKSIGSDYASHWFAMTPNGRKAYMSNKTASFISVIDLEGENMISKIDLPGGCEQPAMSKCGKYAYFPTPGMTMGSPENPKGAAIKVIDTSKDEIVKSIPIKLGATAVHVDSQDRILVGQYRFGFSAEANKQTPQKGELLALSSAEDGHRELGAVETGILSLTLFSSPDGKRAFVANIFAGTVTVVDMEKMAVQRTLEVDLTRRPDKPGHQGAHGLALMP